MFNHVFNGADIIGILLLTLLFRVFTKTKKKGGVASGRTYYHSIRIAHPIKRRKQNRKNNHSFSLNRTRGFTLIRS